MENFGTINESLVSKGGHNDVEIWLSLLHVRLKDFVSLNLTKPWDLNLQRTVPTWGYLSVNANAKIFVQTLLYVVEVISGFECYAWWKNLNDRALMMTLSKGNIYRVTGPLWRESSGHRWIPLTKASEGLLWCILWSTPEQTVKQTIERYVIWDAIALIMTSL